MPLSTTLAAIFLVVILFGCALYWSLRPAAQPLQEAEEDVQSLSEQQIS